MTALSDRFKGVFTALVTPLGTVASTTHRMTRLLNDRLLPAYPASFPLEQQEKQRPFRMTKPSKSSLALFGSRPARSW